MTSHRPVLYAAITITAIAVVVVVAVRFSHRSAGKSPPSTSSPTVPTGPEATWTAALTAHSRFVANSATMSHADRQVALRQIADQFAKALDGAPELQADEIKHRLLGIYATLGDLESARAINKSLLVSAKPDERADLETNLAELEASLAARKPENREQSERALAQLDKGIAAAVSDQDVNETLTLLESKATLLGRLGKQTEAVTSMRQAIDLCANLPAGKQTILPPHERARLTHEAMLIAAPWDDEHAGRAFLSELRQLKDDLFTPARAVLEFHAERNALAGDAFVADALEILGGPSDPSFADLRLALCTNRYLPKNDHESVVKQLTMLINEKELDKTSDYGGQRKTYIANTLPTVYSMLADSLVAIGEKAQAEFYYVKLASGFPEHPYGKHAQQVLENWQK